MPEIQELLRGLQLTVGHTCAELSSSVQGCSACILLRVYNLEPHRKHHTEPPLQELQRECEVLSANQANLMKSARVVSLEVSP